MTKRQRRRRRKAAGSGTDAGASRDGRARAAGAASALAGEPPAQASRKPRRRKRRGAPGHAAAPGTGPQEAAPRGQGHGQPTGQAVGPAEARGAMIARQPAGHAAIRPAPDGTAPRRAASDALSEARPPERPPVYAALDLGTNNCRLLVAMPTRPGQFRVVDAFSRIVRLGEGLGRTGSLSGGAMDRAVAALGICAQKLAARDVRGARLIATEACRAAANGVEFIERVEKETGLSLEIVSRETEARLAVSGCGSLVDRGASGAVLFDIGGGSSEIALLDLRGGMSRRLASNIVAWTSLPTGVVTLAEKHGGRNVTPEIFETMIAETVALIEGFPDRHKLDAIVGGRNFHLLGTSGTVTTLAGIHLKLERYDRRQVDGLWLTSEEADELVARIASWSFEDRVANPCIGSDRADLVLAGCAILEAIRRVWPAPRLRVADRGLREGLLTEMMVADNAWRRADAVRRAAS
ncbi:Ppx/GppA phosphatase family protein [Aurantimonas sp. Leaf443]|uniref:Ppx/GppA phosphatase family protein n=1 Tax=Aurantimonas sp. Leaf443 TaxID=1736378 RepID=UPI0006F97A18|nr:Ppx/GppA phosphatase family protein [Aurantimonas sp. Leaf443]KQT84162.1 exopolyphosphatase [Aurantimonas sp. Leaf443]